MIFFFKKKNQNVMAITNFHEGIEVKKRLKRESQARYEVG